MPEDHLRDWEQLLSLYGFEVVVAPERRLDVSTRANVGLGRGGLGKILLELRVPHSESQWQVQIASECVAPPEQQFVDAWRRVHGRGWEPCVTPLVLALNRIGVWTEMSCEGHPRRSQHGFRWPYIQCGFNGLGARYAHITAELLRQILGERYAEVRFVTDRETLHLQLPGSKSDQGLATVQSCMMDASREIRARWVELASVVATRKLELQPQYPDPNNDDDDDEE